MATENADVRADLAAALEQLLGEDEDAALGRRTGRGRLTVNVREDRVDERTDDVDELAAAMSRARSRAGVAVRADNDLPPIRRVTRPESMAELLRTELPNGGIWSAVWLTFREFAYLSILGWLALIGLSLWQPTTEVEIAGGLVPIWQLALAVALIARSMAALTAWGARAVSSA